MKTSRFIITLPVLVLAAAISTNLSHAQTAASPAPGAGLGNQATPCAVVERGANYNLWQREIYEQAPNGSIVMNIHKYTELTTGLNHLVNGQWVHTVTSSQPVEVQVYGFGYEDACGYFGGVVK